MLKKLAILVLAIFCIIVEITVNTKCLSLSKRARTVFSSKVENVKTIEIRKIALMQGPKTIETIEVIDEENKIIEKEEKAVEEEQMEFNMKTEEREEDKEEEKQKEETSNINRNYKTYAEKNIEEDEENEDKEENEINSIDKNNVNHNDENEVKTNLDNCLIIGQKVIKIKIAPGIQANINAYDVVQDNEYFSDEDNIIIFGHNYNSFRCLKSINVGEKIKLSNNGKIEEYVVFRSENGIDNSDSVYIYSTRDGEELLYNLHGYDETLKLVTCEENGRWVISAYKI